VALRAAPHIAAAGDTRARLAGIGLTSGSLVFFAILDATAKWLGQAISPVEIVWARYIGHFLLCWAVLNPWFAPGVWRTARPGIHILRGLLLIGTTLGNFFALQYLRLDQTMSIFFSMPFFVALLAGPLLGEWIGPRRWIAILTGFVGVLLVVRPTAEGIHPAALSALAGSVCYAGYNITTRILAPTDSTGTMMLYSSLIGTVLTSLALPWVWSTPSAPAVILNMTLAGIYGAAGHLLLVLAHQRAPASVLAPFLYSQIIWMALLGWLVFGQVPDGWTLAGAAIVIASGLYLISRERAGKAEQAIEANITDSAP